jgi:hypothetical protein
MFTSGCVLVVTIDLLEVRLRALGDVRLINLLFCR